MNLFFAAADVSLAPLGVLLASIIFIVVAIGVLRMHAFIALILAALFAGWLTPGEPGHFVQVIKDVSAGFGATAAGVGIVIALAAIIGMCLMDSGAADRIVRTFMNVFGEKRAGWALLISGFVLSIPVFFDTMFFLVIPIARMLAIRTGKNYLFFVLCIGAGGAITHSIVPPTPGPLLVGNELQLNVGTTIIAGLAAGILPAIVAMYFAKWLNAKGDIPVRSADGEGEPASAPTEKSDSELPSFFAAVFPILLPVVLLGAFSVIDMVEENNLRKDTAILDSVTSTITADSQVAEADRPQAIKKAYEAELDKPENHTQAHTILKFLGDKIIALGLGALAAMLVLMRQTKLNLKEIGNKCAGPLETAGLIILITSAGGAFGKIIKATGISDVMQAYAEDWNINLILLAWFVTAIVRIAQGSATVSMITGVALMTSILDSGIQVDYHVAYIYLAIGFGSITCSWMNDSGFWIVGRLSGFTERETLRSWTPMLTIIAVVGLIETLIMSKILPLAG